MGRILDWDSLQNFVLLTLAYSWSTGKVLFFTKQIEGKVIVSSDMISKFPSSNKSRDCIEPGL